MRMAIFILLCSFYTLQAGAQGWAKGGSNQRVIQIHITDKDSEQPLSRVSIAIKESDNDENSAVWLSDSLGNGYIDEISDGQEAVLEATSVGYLAKKVIITKNSPDFINIALEKDFRRMDTVAITGYPTQVRWTLGCRCPSTIRNYMVVEVMDKKRYNPVSAFHVYPNPAAQAAVICIRYNEAMDGTMQISNSGGQLVRHQNIKAAAGQIIRLSLGIMTSGLYVISFANTVSKEVFSQKLIIQ